MDPSLLDLIDRLNQLSDQFTDLREGIRKAILLADDDPEMALTRVRKVLEYVVRDAYQRLVKEPFGTRTLEEIIRRLLKDGHLPPHLESYTSSIRLLGNGGAHHAEGKYTPHDVTLSLTQLRAVLDWYCRNVRADATASTKSLDRTDNAAEPLERPQKRRIEDHVAVVPKGLRSFDANDSDFFLQLLPGARDKVGLPESIRFWKHRIEATDDPSFTVGVIYGPSGCGKSSLVKAGLLPRLAKRIISVYVEATPDETETRLLNGLRRKLVALPGDLDLKQTISAIRQGQGLHADQKVVIVLDQFEQWLHPHRTEQDRELARALRQCDGDHVQCVLMVRDDFWVALTRFMDDLHIELVQGQNAALVDLFDPIHARKVLTEFGRSYGHLPALPESPSKDQDAFLDSAVEGLSRDGRVVPIRLALFGEMVKGKPWSPATLKQIGGTEGVGVAFLDETINTAALRPHQNAVQAVLRALLPESGTDIKGRMRSYEELTEAGGYGGRPREFDNLLRMLDSEVRLITPTDPERQGASGERHETNGKYYQLTHDYLVPSLREWLTRKQKETRRGRAELRLAERCSLWNAKPENRHLPSLLEWATIRLLTRKKDWNDSQRRMMQRAGRLHGLHTLGVAILIALLTWGGIEGYGTLRASSLVDALRTASTTDVPAIVRQLTGYRRWANPRLKTLVQNANENSREKLHASLALLPVDPSQLPFLEKHLLNATSAELLVIRDALEPHRATLTPKLWTVLDSAKPGDGSLLQAASALASYDPASSRWESVGGKVAQALVTVNPVYIGPWLDALRLVRTKLNAPLASIFREKSRPESEHALATSILSDYASDDPNLVANLLMDADPKAYASFFPLVQRQKGKTSPLFQAEIARKATIPDGDKDAEIAKDRLAEHQARAAIALLRMGKTGEIMPLLQHSADPRLRSFIVNWLNPLGADPHVIATALEHIDPSIKPTPVEPPKKMDAILFHPETSMRRALILALGTYGTEGLSLAEREPLTVKLLDLYRNDPDSGIHGAAAWTLRQWKQQESLKAVDNELAKLKNQSDRRWFVNSQGQTFAVIEGPVEFRMGSPLTEPNRDTDETLRRIVIPRRFAIADREVTVEQYQRFVKTNPLFGGITPSDLAHYSPDGAGPMIFVTWYGAAAYCNWLSEQEGLPKDQWCYLPNQGGTYDEGMTIPADVLKRTGYRLPTEAEWEYTCRSGTVTSRCYGLSTDLLAKYAWYQPNSQEHAWPGGSLLPNELGLFDMLGNVFEWVQDRHERPVDINDDINNIEYVTVNPRLLRGGGFYYPAVYVRSAFRTGHAPSVRISGNDFRPSRTYP
jgi:eukaryotic-like serine/threonine-protein kinase